MPSSKDAIHHDPATQEAIQKLVSGIATGRRADLLTDMMKTVVGYGLDDASIGDLKLVSRSMSEMRYAASVFQEYNKVRKVAVFGSARTKSDEADFQLAREFSRRIVEEDYMIITGGGDGIMGAAQQAGLTRIGFVADPRVP